MALCEVCFGGRNEGSDPCPHCLKNYKMELANGKLPPGLEGFTEKEFPFDDWSSIKWFQVQCRQEILAVNNSLKSEQKKAKKRTRIMKKYGECIDSIISNIQQAKLRGEERVGESVLTMRFRKNDSHCVGSNDPYEEYRDYLSHR